MKPGYLLPLVILLTSGCDSDRLKKEVNPLHLPPEGLTVDAVKGKALFEQNCQSCHGIAAAGSDKGPPLVDKIYRPAHHANLAFHLAVKNGVRSHHWNFSDMPPQPQISPTDAAHILQYIRQLQLDAGIYSEK
jgi:mono/diheme cytochrome c family protein